MSEPKDLLLANEYLRRSKRRWKALALAACAALLAFVLLLGFVAVYTALVWAHRLRAMSEAQASAERAARAAAVRPAQPK